MNERKTPAHNIGFALWGLTCFYYTFAQDSTFVLRMNFVLKLPTTQSRKPLVATLKDRHQNKLRLDKK